MRTGARAVTAAIALALGGAVLASCGGSNADDATGATVPTTPTTTVTSAPAPTSTTSGGSSTEPVVGRSYAVGVTDTTFVDPSRATSANGGVPGSSDRTFPVTIWYPIAGAPGAEPARDAAADPSGGPYPLVVFAHGYAVTPSFYAELLERWAAAGYVVAAPTYPIWSGPSTEENSDYELSFGDTSFVITRLLALNAGAAGSSPIARLVDPSRIGVAGHSNGLVVAYGEGFLECCRDPRVKSVVAMAGNLGNISNPVQRENGVPLMHLMGDADEVAPYGTSFAWDRANLGAPRWLVTLVGGSHAAPFRAPGDPRFDGVVAVTTAFLDGTLKGSAARLDAIDGIVAADGDRLRLER